MLVNKTHEWIRSKIPSRTLWCPLLRNETRHPVFWVFSIEVGAPGPPHLYRYMKYQCVYIIKSLAVPSFVSAIKSYQYQANQFHNTCWITFTADTNRRYLWGLHVLGKYLVTRKDFQKIRHKIVMPFLHLSFCPNPVDGSSCYVRQFEWIPV